MIFQTPRSLFTVSKIYFSDTFYHACYFVVDKCTKFCKIEYSLMNLSNKEAFGISNSIKLIWIIWYNHHKGKKYFCSLVWISPATVVQKYRGWVGGNISTNEKCISVLARLLCGSWWNCQTLTYCYSCCCYSIPRTLWVQNPITTAFLLYLCIHLFFVLHIPSPVIINKTCIIILCILLAWHSFTTTW